MTKLCECGCGNPAPISKKHDPRRGIKKGDPQRYILGHKHFKNLTDDKKYANKKFGKLTVIKRIGTRAKNSLWLCICECGNKTEVMGGHLNSGHTQSCGCLNKEKLSEWNKKQKKESQKKEFCMRGHKFDEKNTWLENGKKRCKRCRMIQSMKYYNMPGTYMYEHNNPNGKYYGETLRKRRKNYDEQANERDLNKLWQLQN